MVSVTPAEPHDVPAIAGLLEEMDRFYGATEIDPLDLRMSQISDALFSSPPAASALLAWNDGQLVGFAAYSFLWPAVGLTRSLYLKELYVAREARRLGIGTLLMQQLFEVAAKTGCSRVEWTTDEGNLDAQHFYELLGYDTYPGKVFYRVEEREIVDSSDS